MAHAVAARQTAKSQRTASAGVRSQHRAPKPSDTSPAGLIRRLHHSSGNATVHRLLRSRTVQPTLTVNRPGDQYELEAERVSEAIVRMPASRDSMQRAERHSSNTPQIPRIVHRYPSPARGVVSMFATSTEDDPLVPAWMCSQCAGQRAVETSAEDVPEKPIQRQATGRALSRGGPVRGDLETELQSLSHGGHPMPGGEREYFENRFGTSFADVRLQTDHRADRLARALDAEAFAFGTRVAFREGRYRPGTNSGRRLLAHELAHVVQQTGRPQTSRQVQRTIGDGHDLVSPRFRLNVQLEAAFDGERLIRRGAIGEHVRLLQDSLLAMGYALPRSVSRAQPGRGDGDFREETEAAIKQFQTDAGAVLVDGIVGPETMGLFDTHDVTRPGARPPVRTGPVPDPLARGGCDRHFTGVTFTLANQVATGVAPAADIRVVVFGGRPLLRMRGIAPINYDPQITIAAPNNPTAANFRVGFVQNLLTTFRRATYSGGAQASTVVPVVPIKDGDPVNYHPIFVSTLSPARVEDYATAGQTINLDWPDRPADGKFINLLDDTACGGRGLAAQQMTTMAMVDSFRIWVVVQHRPSGCVRSLHHVDWFLNWLALVNAATTPATVTVLFNQNVVTQGNGDGSPAFLQGGPVPGQTAVSQCT